MKKWIERLGLAFHPDTRGADYINDDGKRTLSDGEAEQYDRDIDEAFETHADPYGVALTIMEELELI